MQSGPCTPDECLAKARTGDPGAFAELVRAHRRAVFSLALRMLASRELAEDLAQEVFMRLHRNLHAIESAQHLAFWLRRVTANGAIDRLRRPRLVTATLDEAVELPAPSTDSDPLLQRELERLIGRLAPAARAVMLLRYQEDLDPVEIARTLELPVNTVKSHLKRSLASLRVSLGEADAAAVGVASRTPDAGN
jgi:RNA polymerase sigma-70 factor, ECF subfamily